MGAEGKLPPKQRKRKRSPAEPEAPGLAPRGKTGKTAPGKAASDLGTRNTTQLSPVRLGTAAKRLAGPDSGATASSGASDVSSGEVGSSPAAPGSTVHVGGYCEKRFGPGKLVQHERVHSRDAPSFYCSFCPKQFRHQSKATIHERIHTKEKPYGCSMCPRRFSDKSAVPRHERTHTGEKPYACSMCPKRFAHERTHMS